MGFNRKDFIWLLILIFVFLMEHHAHSSKEPKLIIHSVYPNRASSKLVMFRGKLFNHVWFLEQAEYEAEQAKAKAYKMTADYLRYIMKDYCQQKHKI